MSDGKIVFSTELDNKGLEKELSDLKKKIRGLEDQIGTNQKLKSPLLEQSKQLAAELDQAKAKLYEMQNASAGVFTKEQLADQKENVGVLQGKWNSIQRQVDGYDRKIQEATIKLTENKAKAGEVEQQLAQIGPSGRKMADAMEAAQKSANRFKLRLKEVIRSALVFTLITQSLAGFREWMGKLIKTNDEAAAAMARLKGALLTLAQPLVDVIIPAFTALVNVLTAVVGKAAQLVAALFGTTAESAAASADALNEQTKALEGTGSAAKKAGKSLASFDEINKLSGSQEAGGSSADTIAPDFSWADTISEELQRIAEDVLMIGAGLALWKISESLPGMLGMILGKLGGLLVALGGIMLYYEGITDAWENGVDWGNLAAMIAGTAAAAFGLYSVFGKTGAGIALVLAGIGMLVTGFKDVIENGANLKNVLLIITGIISTGLGIGFLTKSPIPALIAGIAAIITAIVAWQGNMEEFAKAFKEIFSGIIDFFTGVFTGNFELAWKGIKNIVFGIINAIVIAFESFVNTIIDGLNWLISKANSVADTVGIGSFIPEISQVELPRIPYLAQGAVIPPNREFLAVLGDQKSGTNIETPLSTMVQAFKTAMQDMNTGGQNEAYLVLDDEVLGKIIYRLYNKEDRRVGVSLSTK